MPVPEASFPHEDGELESRSEERYADPGDDGYGGESDVEVGDLNQGLSQEESPPPVDQTRTQEDTAGRTGDEGSADDDSAGGEWYDTEDVREVVSAYGINPQFLQSLKGPEQLEAAIQFHNQQMMAYGQQVAYGNQQPGQWDRPPQQQQVPPQQAGQQGRPDVSEQTNDQIAAFAYQLNLNPDDLPEELVKGLEGMNRHYAEKTNQLVQAMSFMASQMAGQQNFVQSQQASAYFSDLDNAIGSLDKETQEIVSDGAAYNQLDQSVRLLAAGYQAQGMQIPPVKQLVKAAVSISFPQRLAQAARNQFADQYSRRQSRSSARPSRASGMRNPKTGDERAVRRAEKFFAEHADELGSDIDEL